jgi:hypothetical protein
MDIIISNEIKKNGNTNLISDSGLETGQQIFAIGDSHSIFFYNSMKIKEHWFHDGELSITIYKLIKYDLDIYNIGTILKNGHELYNIKANDFVLFYYGFNDIQKNIYLHAKDSWADEITYLMNEYIKKILLLKNKFNIIPIIPMIYPNPLPDALGQDARGSYEERHQYTLYANIILKKLCVEYSILYLDLYDYISDENGFILEKFTKDKIHLDYDNVSLRDYVENKIFELCRIR